MSKTRFLSWNTIGIIIILVLLGFIALVSQIKGMCDMKCMVLAWILFGLALLVYLVLYVMILIDIVRNGSRTGWILFWIIGIILQPLHILVTIIYLAAGQEVVSKKTLLEKAKVNINISNVKDLRDLDRSIKSENEKFCSECGEKIKKTAKFCEKCGRKQVPQDS